MGTTARQPRVRTTPSLPQSYPARRRGQTKRKPTCQRAARPAGDLWDRPPANSARPARSTFAANFGARGRGSDATPPLRASSGTSTVPGRTTARQWCAARPRSMEQIEIPKRFEPAQSEDKWYGHWMRRGYFRSVPDDREPYTVVIPPPNVTGVLHLGNGNGTVAGALASTTTNVSGGGVLSGVGSVTGTVNVGGSTGGSPRMATW